MPVDCHAAHTTRQRSRETILTIKEAEFLPDPLQAPPEAPEPTVAQEMINDLDKMKEDLIKLQSQKLEAGKEKEELLPEEEPLPEPKEELLPEEVVKHDVAVSEATAGKIQLPKLVPVKTIRLDIENFSAFMGRKFYKYKIDYDLYFEVNADSPEKAEEKIMEFLKQELPALYSRQPDGELENQGVEEFIPTKKYETEEYS